MCKLTNEGYQLKDGKVIPFHNCRIEFLSADEFQELSASKASILDTLLIRDALHAIRGDMQKIINRLDSLCVEHKDICPANKDNIETLIQETINKQPKKAFDTAVKWSKDLTVLLLLILNFALVYKVFFNG